MATVTQPMPARDEPRRPNLARADIQLPAVKDYEQVDREISGTLRPTLAWFLDQAAAEAGRGRIEIKTMDAYAGEHRSSAESTA